VRSTASYAARRKTDPASMGLDSIVEFAANLGTTLSIAYRILAWLRARPSVMIEIERDEAADSLKKAVEGFDTASPPPSSFNQDRYAPEPASSPY
jgi:hypothetical protein